MRVKLGQHILEIGLRLKVTRMTEEELLETAKLKLLRTDAGLTHAILALFPNMKRYKRSKGE